LLRRSQHTLTGPKSSRENRGEATRFWDSGIGFQYSRDLIFIIYNNLQIMHNAVLVEIRVNRRIRVLHETKKSNTTFFFVHGAMGSADQFELLVNYFAGDCNCNVCAYDMLGCVKVTNQLFRGLKAKACTMSQIYRKI